MKSYAIFAVLAFASLQIIYADIESDEIDIAVKECEAQYGLDKHDAPLDPNDEKTHCAMKCIYVKLGVHDEKGNFVIPKLEELLGVKMTNEQQKQVFECEEKARSSNVCRMIYYAEECIYKIFHGIE